MVIDECPLHQEATQSPFNPESLKVRLIRTGSKAGLSQDIDFQSIESEVIEASTDGNEIVTSLPTAINFLIALDKREMKAHPELESPKSIDCRGMGHDKTWYVKGLGWSEETIQGPSMGWSGRSNCVTRCMWCPWLEGRGRRRIWGG